MFEIHSHFVKKLVNLFLITYQAQLLNLDKKLPSTPIKEQNISKTDMWSSMRLGTHRWTNQELLSQIVCWMNRG